MVLGEDVEMPPPLLLKDGVEILSQRGEEKVVKIW